jgi:eukaryotic-like serine/threonine-protein kinase
VNHPTPGIDEVFFAAMERESPEDRAAYLDAVCGSDAELRRRVERLLEAQPRVGDFLDSPAVGPTMNLPSPHEIEAPGTVIGPFKLLEQIGEGGMGIVYMAEQAQPVRRKVALKVIKPGMDTKQVIARFEAERQALAMMDHPNIAKVLDAGATESGRPYFVMELVRGIPITEYCDQHRLSINRRLDLFTQVCQAVQHAHQKGIIHRDIKPTNVLVTALDGAPLPRVIDFGIAKATGQTLTDKTLFTGFAQLIGTPLYMSPEQAELSAVDVDTRSDIYSLGVLLYELLTGTTPFDQDTFRTAALDEVRRIIREDEPPKPSTRLSGLGATLTTVSANRQSDARVLGRSLRGELDWIVMKAIEKDRGRRYETASGLARDVARYLAGDALEAGPPSGWYRLHKFARRNRVVLTASVLIALALIAGTTVSVWQAVVARRARANALSQRDRAMKAEEDAVSQRDRAMKAEADAISQRNRAEANFRRAQDAVDQMLTEASEKALAQVPQAEPIRRALLEKAAAFYRDFLSEQAAAPALHYESAQAYSRLARVEAELGHLPEAALAFERQIALLHELLSRDREHAEYLRDLVWADFRLAWQKRNRGDLDAALVEMGRAVETAQELVDRFPTNAADRKSLARSLDLQAATLWQTGKLSEAEKSFNRSIEISERLIRENRADAPHAELAAALNNLAGLRITQGKHTEAAALLEKAISHQKDVLRADPKSDGSREFLRNQYENLAVELAKLGKPDEAIRRSNEIIVMGQELVTEHPWHPSHRRDLAESYHNFANILKGSGRLLEAESHFGRAIEIGERLTAEFPDMPEVRLHLVWSHNDLGLLLADRRRFKEARDSFRHALWLSQGLIAKFPHWPSSREVLAEVSNSLAWLLATCSDSQIRQPDEAVTLARKAVELAPEKGNNWNTLGVAYYRTQDWDSAVTALEKSSELNSGGAADAWFFLAAAHWQKGEKDRARQWYDKAVVWMGKNKPKDEELLRFRAEAEALLGVSKAPKAAGRKEENEMQRP